MRDRFNDRVESARVRHGKMRSKTGDPFGFFFIIPKDHKTLLRIMVGSGDGWDHVSVSAPGRCPTWDEMCAVKRLFFRDDEWVVQYHPAETEYVNRHPFVLHLWRPQNAELPKPPEVMV